MKIYFDLDNTLADFDRGVREQCGVPHDAPEDVVFPAIKDTPGFFANLKPMPGAIALFRSVCAAFPGQVEVLSAAPKPKHGIVGAEKDKRTWVRKYLSPTVKTNIVLRREKRDYCTGPDCVLIDDFDMNIDEWREHGGIGILFTDADSAFAQLQLLFA